LNQEQALSRLPTFRKSRYATTARRRKREDERLPISRSFFVQEQTLYRVVYAENHNQRNDSCAHANPLECGISPELCYSMSEILLLQ
jgi:hypothetical protein